MSHSFRPPRRRGTAFIIVLGVLFILCVTINTFVMLSRVGFQATIARNYSARMDIICNGILQQVRLAMARDLESTQEPFDHPAYDPWLASVNPSGGQWAWISRLDIPDRPDPTLVGQPGPAGRTRPVPAAVAAVAPAVLDLTGNYYADADGDGIADSILLPVASGTQFPDGVKAYYALRVIDNAHFNSRHHVKWERYTNGIAVPDQTDGRLDSTAGRPRLPHVNLRGLRNLGQASAFPGDNPDTAPNDTVTDPNKVPAAGEPGWDYDNGFDRWLGTDNSATVFDPTMIPPPFTYEDDLGIKSYGSDSAITKYLQLWPNTFSATTGTPATDQLRNNARRLVSSVTRTRAFNWTKPVGAAAGTLQLLSPFDMRKFAVDDPAKTAAQNQAAAVVQMELLFNLMKDRNILQTDAKRAQYLANLYEYLHPDPGPTYDPIVYRGMIGFTRQVYLSEVIREGDQVINLNSNGGTRNQWQGRFGVEIYNPYDKPISLAPYSLKIDSVLPNPNTIGYTAGAIVQPSVTIAFGNVNIPAFTSFFCGTDNNSNFNLPNTCAMLGPRIVVTLQRNVTGFGQVVYDQLDTRRPAINGKYLNFDDWDVCSTANDQAIWIAAINNGWKNNGNKKVSSKDGVRSAIYRPQGDPTASTPQYPAHMTDEWIGLASTARNQSNLMAPGQGAYGSAGAPNPGQALTSLTAPVTCTNGDPFIFGYPITLPKRGKLANLGELARVLVVGNTATQSITRTFGASSLTSRTNSPAWGPAGNTWAWLNGERSLRFDVYDPAVDANNQPYANARLLDLVSLSLTASGNNGPFDPQQYKGDGTDRYDDTGGDSMDVDGNGLYRPAYREGLININTAPPEVLQNLVFPRAYRTGDRVTSGTNVQMAQELYNYVHAQGNAFANLSDIVLWAKSANAANFATSTNAMNYRWDMGLNVAGLNQTALGGSNDYDAPFSQAYPSFPDAAYASAPAWRVHYKDEGYVNHMAERDMIWAGNTNVMTTRSDVFTVYVLVKLVRFDPTKPSIVEDLGEARLIALVDRSLCNPVASPTAKPVALPRVLALQFTE